MIHYELLCFHKHAFDGWFRDSNAFVAQAERGLVTCPECGDTRVHRALMAPSIGRKAAEPTVQPAPVPAAGSVVARSGVPDKVWALLQRMRTEVEQNCEHVGTRFAEEARAIHHGEAEARGIYGEATPEQAEALAEEGIEVGRIPWVPRADG